VIYFVSLLPALIAGCPLIDLLKTYFAQITVYHSLSMNTPNLYFPFTDAKYFSHKTVLIGLLLAGAFTLYFIILRMKIPAQPKPQIVFWDACFFGFFVPYLLPEMHERYFFTFAIFIILAALFLDTRAIIPAILAQISSVFSYLQFLLKPAVNLTAIAFYINLVVMAWIFFLYWKRIHNTSLDSQLDISTHLVAN
jgi:hypothetical protein